MTRDISNTKGALVSVIVPVYNVEVYLRRCLDSIVDQTYTNLEIIVIDDGSTDRSSAICDKFAAEDPRIQVIHQNNQGLSAARNAGLDVCCGDYICFVDSDDWIEPDMVEALYTAVINNTADIACCERYIHKGTIVTEDICDRIVIIEDTEEIINRLLLGYIDTMVWNKIYKSELFDRELRFPTGQVYEDISMTWKILLRCRKIVMLPEPGYHNTVRSNSISHTNTTENLRDYWTAQKERLEVLAVTNEAWKKIETENCMNIGVYIWKRIYPELYRSDHTDEREELLKDIHCFMKENKNKIFDGNSSLVRKTARLFPLINHKVSIAACYYVDYVYQRAKLLAFSKNSI